MHTRLTRTVDAGVASKGGRMWGAVWRRRLVFWRWESRARGLEKHLGCQCESREFVGFSCGKGRVGALKRVLLSAGGLL